MSQKVIVGLYLGGNGMERNQEYQAGELKVSEDVISTIVKVVIDDIDGIQEMSPPAPSFKQMFIKKKNNTSIGIKLDGDVVEISVSIVIKLGYKVTSIASEIQESGNQMCRA